MIINNAKQVSLFKTDLTFTVVYYALKWPETYIVALFHHSFLLSSLTLHSLSEQQLHTVNLI